jgi:hypothetical protein
MTRASFEGTPIVGVSEKHLNNYQKEIKQQGTETTPKSERMNSILEKTGKVALEIIGKVALNFFAILTSSPELAKSNAAPKPKKAATPICRYSNPEQTSDIKNGVNPKEPNLGELLQSDLIALRNRFFRKPGQAISASAANSKGCYRIIPPNRIKREDIGSRIINPLYPPVY